MNPRNQVAATCDLVRLPLIGALNATADHPNRASQPNKQSTTTKPRPKLEKNQCNVVNHNLNPTPNKIVLRPSTQAKSEARSTKSEHQNLRSINYEGEETSYRKIHHENPNCRGRRWCFKNFRKKKKGNRSYTAVKTGKEERRRAMKKGRSGRKQCRWKKKGFRDGARNFWLLPWGWWRRWYPSEKGFGPSMAFGSSIFSKEDSVLGFKNQALGRTTGSHALAKCTEDGKGLFHFAPYKIDIDQGKRLEEIRMGEHYDIYHGNT